MLEVGLLCAAVLLGPVAVRTVVHEVRHWKHARNLVRVTQAEYEPPRRDFYGSMSLDGEREYALGRPVWPTYGSLGYLPAEPRLPDASTREHLLAELAPETLDPGPGAPSSAETSPGPDPLWEYHADHPAVLPERVSLPRVAPELGPRAQAVLDRYQERYQERWAFTAPPGIGVLA